MDQWFSYALELSNLFTRFKFSLYEDAITSLVTHKEQEALGVCGAAAAAGEKAENPPSSGEILSLHRPFLMTKAPVDGARMKSREMCLDEVEYQKELVYYSDSVKRLGDGFVLRAEDEEALQRELAAPERWFQGEANNALLIPTGSALSPSLELPLKQSTSLYGEVTSYGIRQLYALQREVLDAYWQQSKWEEAAERSEAGLCSAMLVNVDIGSGTGKALYEWNLLPCLEAPFPSTRSHSVKTEVRGLGIEILPSRMVVAKTVLDSFVEIIGTLQNHSLRLERFVGDGDEEDHQHPRKRSQPHGTSSEASQEELLFCVVNKSQQLKKVYDSVEEACEAHREQRSSRSASGSASSFTASSNTVFMLTLLNALHPRVLCNETLLPFRPPHAASHSLSLSTSHLGVLCCGVGFDELFIRRLCFRLEQMLFPSASAERGSGWASSSIVLLLPQIDLLALQSAEFPLFRKVQQWTEHRMLPTCPRTVSAGEPWGAKPAEMWDAPSSPPIGFRSRLQYTTIQTTWMNEAPAWHLQFCFVPCS